LSESRDIEKTHVSIKRVVVIVLFCISATFALTMIYAEFLYMKGRIDKVEERIEYVNDRVTRKIK